MRDRFQSNASIFPRMPEPPSATKQMMVSRVSADEKEHTLRGHPLTHPDSTPEENRNLRLDNVKGLLILLVVIHHAGLVFEGSMYSIPGAARDFLAYGLKYLRMPVFVFISGYLTSPRRGVLHAVSTVGMVFVIMHAVLLGWRFVWGDFTHGFNKEILTYGQGFPTYLKLGTGTMWYLTYLMIWRSLAPLVAAIRWPKTAIAVSLVLGIVSQMRGNDIIFIHTPFFLAGICCRVHHWRIADRLPRLGWERPLVIAGFVASLGLCFVTYSKRSEMFFSARWACFTYVVGFIMACFSVRLILGAMTDKLTFLVRLGVSTLPIYVGHIFVLDFFKRVFLSPHANFFVLVSGSVLFAVLIFGHPWLLRPIQKMCKLGSSFIFDEKILERSEERAVKVARSRHD